MNRPSHIYVVTDPADLGPPVVRRYRFRAWARGGCTVWDRGRIRYVQSRVRRQWVCGTLDAVRDVLGPILAARRGSLRRVMDAIDRIERDGIRAIDVPEGGISRKS